MLSPLEWLSLGLPILCSFTIIAMLLLQQLHMRRYEQFRGEISGSLGRIDDGFADINRRLTAAGFPPNEPAAAPSDPAWVPRPVERQPRYDPR